MAMDSGLAPAQTIAQQMPGPPRMPPSREEREFKFKASRSKFCSDRPMTGPPGCTSEDFSVPRLRKCAFDVSSISFIKTIGKGHDGYCWLVTFGGEGPFVLKVFRDRDPSARSFAPRREGRNAALFQMMEESVKQGQQDGKPPLVIKEPSKWVDAIDNIRSFADESRKDPESLHKWAAENSLELVPVSSVPRLRRCYGWLQISNQVLWALPSGIRPITVVVSRKDRWTFEAGTDENGDDIQSYALVYEYMEAGENDPEEVQQVLDFLHQVGFTDTGSPCGHNWQSNVLLDLADVISPYDQFWHAGRFYHGLKAEWMLRS